MTERTEPTDDQIWCAAFRWVDDKASWDFGCDELYFIRNWQSLPNLRKYVEEECARSAKTTGVAEAEPHE